MTVAVIEELKRQLADLESKKRQTPTIQTRRRKLAERIKALEDFHKESRKKLLLVALAAK